jgi:8-oxo-dGTP diphosphatase
LARARYAHNRWLGALGNAVADTFWRNAYRLAYRVLRLWWWIRRPTHEGAVVAIWVDEKVLLVRQSYRRRLLFPGGGIHRGESAEDAAAREVLEELGLIVTSHELVLARDLTASWENRTDHVRIFELRLPAMPSLKIDRREILTAELYDPREIPAASLPPYIFSYLSGR